VSEAPQTVSYNNPLTAARRWTIVATRPISSGIATAAQSQDTSRHLDPENEARFRALRGQMKRGEDANEREVFVDVWKHDILGSIAGGQYIFCKR